MISLSVDTAKNLVTAGSILPIVVGIVLVKFVMNTIARIVIVVVALGLGALVFTQRSQIDECVRTSTLSAQGASVSCSLLGFDVNFQI